MAIAEYLLQMPADRIGYTTMGLGQLEILHDVVACSNHTAPRCFLLVGAVAVVRSSGDRWSDTPIAIESWAGNRPQAWIPKELKMATVSYPHIELSADGVPYLEGMRTKVVEIALDSLAHHWDAEEIQRQHPHLTMGQIHAALAYYHDHREALDAAIAQQLAEADRVAGQQPPSLLREILKRGGRA